MNHGANLKATDKFNFFFRFNAPLKSGDTDKINLFLNIGIDARETNNFSWYIQDIDKLAGLARNEKNNRRV